MRQWFIEKLGGQYPACGEEHYGFNTADDFLDHMREQGSLEEKNKILTAAVRRLFNTVGADEILRTAQSGEWMLEGRALTKEEKQQLSNEAQSFLQSRLFYVLDKELKYQANRRMFTESQSVMDIVSAKLIVWVWDAVKSRLSRM